MSVGSFAKLFLCFALLVTTGHPVFGISDGCGCEDAGDEQTAHETVSGTSDYVYGPEGGNAPQEAIDQAQARLDAEIDYRDAMYSDQYYGYHAYDKICEDIGDPQVTEQPYAYGWSVYVVTITASLAYQAVEDKWQIDGPVDNGVYKPAPASFTINGLKGEGHPHGSTWSAPMEPSNRLSF